MTQEHIQEGTKLIAKYMGYERVTVGYFGEDDETEWQRQHEEWMDKVGMDAVGDYWANIPENIFLQSDALRYHLSWDRLMPVVQKILNTDYGLNTYQLWVSDSLKSANIDEVFQSVVDFLQSLEKEIV